MSDGPKMKFELQRGDNLIVNNFKIQQKLAFFFLFVIYCYNKWNYFELAFWFAFPFFFSRRRGVLPQQRTVHSPILVLYIPNQSADGEMKTRAGSPRVASYDMMMRLCHDLMTGTTLAGLSFLRQNTKCQRQRGSEGEGVSRWESRRRCFSSAECSLRRDLK